MLFSCGFAGLDDGHVVVEQRLADDTGLEFDVTDRCDRGDLGRRAAHEALVVIL